MLSCFVFCLFIILFVMVCCVCYACLRVVGMVVVACACCLCVVVLLLVVCVFACCMLLDWRFLRVFDELLVFWFVLL